MAKHTGEAPRLPRITEGELQDATDMLERFLVFTERVAEIRQDIEAGHLPFASNINDELASALLQLAQPLSTVTKRKQ